MKPSDKPSGSLAYFNYYDPRYSEQWHLHSGEKFGLDLKVGFFVC